MLHVIATIEIHPGNRDAFLTEFHQIVPAVLAETGCVAYGPTLDAESDLSQQTLKGENVVTIIEQWESLDALKAHLTAPHMLAYRERVKDLVANTTLHLLNPA